MILFTDKIGWRFVVPRHQYFRSLRVAAVVPEIKDEINRQAFIALVLPLWILVAFLALVPGVLGAGLMAISRIMAAPIPDLSELNAEAVESAWKKVPLEEIQDRLGERGKIDPKPSQ